MRHIFRLLFMLAAFMAFPSFLFPQSENVPVANPVYAFLKRMEVKGIIERYHDAVIPLSRRQVAGFLLEANGKQEGLTSVEKEVLQDLMVEFQYDISGTTKNFHTLFESAETTFAKTVEGFFSNKEKFLYAFVDTNLTLFVDGLLTWDARRSTGDDLGRGYATFVQFGGRIRGTAYGHVGYYLQGTNAQFYGDRDVLRRDKVISQAYTLNILDAQNFDFVEGYVRYADQIFSLQVGRERLLWGNGYGDKMILSDNPRMFDCIRAEAEYKSLKYTFIHAWLLGRRSSLSYTLASDSSYAFVEPVNADKYFAGHRIELSFPSLVDIGFQEMAIYSNRSPDLAYLNPVTLIESAQREREERDNVLWAFDLQTHFLNNIELHATVLFDDLHFPKWGTNAVQNKAAFQLGGVVLDPFGISNTSVFVEYTLVDPYTFSHERSRDNDYGSLGWLLGHHIGPNADSWFFRVDQLFSHRFAGSVRFEIEREGNNIYDPSTGALIKNVGGDFLQPYRSGKDSETKEFLGGDLVKTYRLQAYATYEIVNEIFLDLRYEMTRRTDYLAGTRTLDHDYGFAFRVDF